MPEELDFRFCRTWRGGGRWVCTHQCRDTVGSHRTPMNSVVLLHHRAPSTHPWEPLCSPRSLQGVTPLSSRQPARGHPPSVPDVGVGYPESQLGPGGWKSLPQGRWRAAPTLLFLVLGKIRGG